MGRGRRGGETVHRWTQKDTEGGCAERRAVAVAVAVAVEMMETRTELKLRPSAGGVGGAAERTELKLHPYASGVGGVGGVADGAKAASLRRRRRRRCKGDGAKAAPLRGNRLGLLPLGVSSVRNVIGGS